MRKKLRELRKQMREKGKAIRSLVSSVEAENRDMSEAERADWERLRSEVDSLNERIERIEDTPAEEDEDDDDEARDDDQAGDDEEGDEDDKPKRRSAPPKRRSQAPPIAGGRAPAHVRSVSPNHAPAVHTRQHEYSICKAIWQLSDRNRPKLDGLEAEWHQEISQRTGREAQGFFVPHHFGSKSILERMARGEHGIERRALTLTTGSGFIPTVTEASLIEYLYNRAMTIVAGATVISDMENKFALPRQNGTATAAWVGDGGAPSGSNQTIDQVVFTPTTVAAYTDVTRRTMKQASVSAEMVMRQDLSRQVALAVDLAALNGSGSSNQPLGLLQNGSITTLSLYGTNSGDPDYTGLVKQETTVATGNADLGALKYMTSAAGRGKLKSTVKNAGTGYPIYLCENNEVNGYPLLATNQIPSNLTVGSSSDVTASIFGNWNDLVISFFGALDVLVDPYTGSSSNTVRVCVFQDTDIKVRHEASFCNLTFRK